MEPPLVNMSADWVSDVVVLVICLSLSAIFSACETAVTSMGPLKTKHLLEENGRKNNFHLDLWYRTPGRIITTILVVNNVVNILASAVITKLAMQYSQSYAVGIATGITTFFILVFGEVVPKSFAKAHAETLGEPCLKITAVVYFLTFPIVWVLSEFAKVIIHALGSEENSIRPSITEDELEFLINEGGSVGVLQQFKKEMISRVFDFDETKVREIMTPRPYIDAVSKEASSEAVVQKIIKTGRSRLPVYEKDIDNVIGVIFAKDLLRVSLKKDVSTITITEIMREATYVPDSKTIIDVFKNLKKTKNYLAVVIDEHGGTAGLVTMEDIIEEIVGEIQDEFDKEEAKILEVEPNIFDVSGSISLEDCMEYFQVDEDKVEEEESDADTVGGFVLHLIGDLPRVGQKASFENLNFEVTDVGRKRIKRLRIQVNPVVEEDDQERSEESLAKHS